MKYGYIYKTTNLANNKIYIGQSKGNFNPNYFGSGLIIKRAIKSYGRDGFKLELLAFAKDKIKLNKLERKYISEYRKIFGRSILYNIANGGEGFLRGEMPFEVRKKIQDKLKGIIGSNKGRKFPFNWKQNLSKSHIGIKYSGYKYEVLRGRKISAALTGRKVSEEHRQNIIKSLIGNKRAVGKHCSRR